MGLPQESVASCWQAKPPAPPSGQSAAVEQSLAHQHVVGFCGSSESRHCQPAGHPVAVAQSHGCAQKEWTEVDVCMQSRPCWQGAFSQNPPSPTGVMHVPSKQTRPDREQSVPSTHAPAWHVWTMSPLQRTVPFVQGTVVQWFKQKLLVPSV